MLLIQKIVKLLDDQRFDLFREYLKNYSTRSFYPLSLVDAIDRQVDVSQDAAILCREVYMEDEVDEKAMKKFFQLAHYTFRLSSFLAVNYPNYLQHNINLFEEEINTGQVEKAQIRLDLLIEVAEKVEDYSTLQKALYFRVQKRYLEESSRQSNTDYSRLRDVLKVQDEFLNISSHMHQHLSSKGKPQEEDDINVHLRFFKSFVQSKAFVVRKYSRFASLYTLYYFRSPSFYTDEVIEEISSIEKELEKNAYIVHPFLFNIRPNLAFLKLHYTIRMMDTASLLEQAEKINDYSRDVLYWTSFINLPELFSIGVQVSHYVSNYMTAYQEDHLEKIGDEVWSHIIKLRKRCQEILDNPQLEERFTLRYINLLTLYSALLVLGSAEDNKQAIQKLESIFVLYQQVPFHPFIDSIYTTLILAAFNIQDYEKVGESFKRYRKSTKNKVVNQENDLTIQGVYYLSQFLQNGRKQYVKKYNEVLELCKEQQLNRTVELLEKLSDFARIGQ